MPKKKTALTIEERLQQALVPAEEQPYEVPENWVWVRLGDFIDLLRGVSYKKHDVHNAKMENDCLILRGGNIIEGGLDLNADNVYVDKSLVSEAQLIRKNDIIIVSSTGSVKVIGRAGLAFCDYNDIAFGAFLTLARPKKGCNKSFVDLFFQSSLYRQSIRELASGVNINNIRSEYITNMTFPLPPLSEQQRIVERIEELFAKLDEAKEKLQEVADSFAVRKAAILHKAFTGELTKQWRRGNGVSDESWKEISLKDLCSAIGDGLHGTPVYYDNGDYYFINGNNFDENSIVIKETTKKVSVEEYKKYAVDLNDSTVFLSINGTLGKTAFYNGEQVILGKSACYINVGEKLNKSFLKNLFHTNAFINYANQKATGSTIKNLGLKAIRAYLINLPSLPEQHEIVRLIDDLLERERSAQQAAEQALASIDLIKKSILARAFRGELGTNKASEASAVELLKQVLAEN